MGEPLRIFLLHMMNLSNLHTWKCKEIELDPFLLCCTLVCTAEKYIGNGRILLCFLPRLSSPKCQLLNQQSSIGISYIPRPANTTVSASATAQKLVKAGDKTICKKIRDVRGCGRFQTNKNANNITVPPKYTYTLFAYAKG